MTDAITREEKLMEAMATGNPSNIKPITREEMFLAKAGGQDVQTPEPITRREKLLQGIIDNGGGGGSKPEGTITITENGTHDVAEYATAEVMVSGGGDDVLNALIDGSITEVTSNAESVKDNKFQACNELTSVDLPLATSVGNYAFQNCKKLTSVSLPSATSIGSYAFYGCGGLTSVDLPSVTSIKTFAFVSCSGLTSVDLPSATSIGSSAFAGCTSLKAIVLRSETVCTMSNVNAFGNTPFASGGIGGTVYCPASLIEQYQQASNWSALYEAGTCTFLPIEGSEYE